MSFKLVDTIRGKVLQEFDSRELAEKALERQSSEANVSIVEPKKVTKKKNVKKEGD
jgi:hypothetical protein